MHRWRPRDDVHYSYAEYLAALEASSLKLEYCDVVIYAMAAGTRAHAQLAAAAIVALPGALPKTCQISTSDLKIRIEETDLSTFPDVSVVCGDDRGDKLSHYKQIGSLAAVLFVSHRTKRVTVVSRTHAGWSERDFRGGETVSLPLHGATFAVEAIYEGISLDVA